MPNGPVFQLSPQNRPQFRIDKKSIFAIGQWGEGQTVLSLAIPAPFVFRRVWFFGGAGAGIEPTFQITFMDNGTDVGSIPQVSDTSSNISAPKIAFFPSTNLKGGAPLWGADQIILSVNNGNTTPGGVGCASAKDFAVYADTVNIVVTAAFGGTSNHAFLVVQSQNTPFGGGIPT